MSKVIHCECGHDVRGESESEVLERAQEHVRTAHPDMADSITDEQLLAMVEEEPVHR